MMSVLEFFVSRSTFAFVVLIVATAIVGFPKKKTRYRVLLAVASVFSLGAVADWYVNLAVAEMYFRDQSHWLLFLLMAVFAVSTGVLVWELLTLRFFSRLRKRDI